MIKLLCRNFQMIKKIALILFLFFSLKPLFSQNISSGKWSDLFSYNNVLTLREDHGKIIAATENGIFYYTPSSGEITKLSKANGLHEVKISAFDYNPATQTAMVGYTSGAMDLVEPGGITYIVDIPLASGYTGNKRINHISISGNQAVISTGYGVSVYNIVSKGFGDSAFFQNNGVYEASNEAVIKDGAVYSATQSGVKMHKLDVTFPIFSGWSTVLEGNYTNIDSQENLMAVTTANGVQFGDGASFSALATDITNVKDVLVSAQGIVVAGQSSVSVYNTSGNILKTMDVGEKINSGISVNNQIYAGTQLSGILDENKKIYKPDGPYNNVSYKIALTKGQILVSTGLRENRFNDAKIDPRNLGFYFYTGSEWIYPTYFKNNPTVFNVLDAIQNPQSASEIYFANYSMNPGQGIYKMQYDSAGKDFKFVKSYLSDSSVYLNRPVALTFDNNNNLIAVYTALEEAGYINVGYGVLDKSADRFILKSFKVSSQAPQKPFFYENMLWIPMPRQNNFLAFDYNSTPLNFADDSKYFLTVSNGLPTNSFGTLSVAIDKLGDAWIGTDNGLRLLSSASASIKDPDAKLQPIIITQNGLGEELFRDSSILQIEVDSGNQKWVSVDGGGVFYVSPDGQKTIRHFTKENSPLPTNVVTDIKVDEATGKVYFVTYDGIVVYQGDVSNVSENFGDVLVYPNPVVYASFKGSVKIKGLAEKTNIKITDTAGNLVHQSVARGGFYEWDLNNQRGERVASGIYFVLMTNADGTDKATAKIAVVN